MHTISEMVTLFIFHYTMTGKPEFSAPELLFKTCCDRKHITCFKSISQATIEHCRDHIGSLKSETRQNQFVISYMRDHSRRDKSVLYTICGEQVCEVCWRLTYGIRHNKFNELKKKFAHGVVTVEHGRTGRLNTSQITLRLISWMRSFFSKVGDHMPMSDDLHLPSCLTRVDVYQLAKDDLTQGGLPCCSLPHMYKVWNDEFAHVKIPKVKSMHVLIVSFNHLLHDVCRKVGFLCAMCVLQ